jgi:hypothetical protein
MTVDPFVILMFVAGLVFLTVAAVIALEQRSARADGKARSKHVGVVAPVFVASSAGSSGAAGCGGSGASGNACG